MAVIPQSKESNHRSVVTLAMGYRLCGSFYMTTKDERVLWTMELFIFTTPDNWACIYILTINNTTLPESHYPEIHRELITKYNCF